MEAELFVENGSDAALTHSRPPSTSRGEGRREAAPSRRLATACAGLDEVGKVLSCPCRTALAGRRHGERIFT